VALKCGFDPVQSFMTFQALSSISLVVAHRAAPKCLSISPLFMIISQVAAQVHPGAARKRAECTLVLEFLSMTSFVSQKELF